MAIPKRSARSKALSSAKPITGTPPADSHETESSSGLQQPSPNLATDLVSTEALSEPPPTVVADEPTEHNPPSQGVIAAEIPKDPPTLASPLEDLPAKGPSDDQKPAEGLTTNLPTKEASSESSRQPDPCQTNHPGADSDPNLKALTLDSNDTTTPAAKDHPMNTPSFDVVEKTPQHTKRRANEEPKLENSSKRVRVQVNEKKETRQEIEVITIDSDDETPGGNSPSRNPRKPNTRSKVTGRDFKSHMNTEATCIESALAGLTTVINATGVQKKLITSLVALDVETCRILAELSADHLAKSSRQNLVKEFQIVEEKRRELNDHYFRSYLTTFGAATLTKRDLEYWGAQDMKISERIERSR